LTVAEIVLYDGWWDDLRVREHVLKTWVRAPRRATERNPGGLPVGARPCPLPALGRHIFIPGHMFGPDGTCWVEEA
jgi:hypothetical protein